MDIFKEEDLRGLWKEEDLDETPTAPLTDELIARVEAHLGYKLPLSYIELMKGERNGGYLRRNTISTGGQFPQNVSGNSIECSTHPF